MNSPTQAITRFFDDLRRHLGEVQVTDGAGAGLDFASGAAGAVELFVERARGGRKLMFVGNGASAAIASHQSVDYWKTGGVRAMAFNDPALLTCVGNDHGYARVFEKPVEMFADRGDVLVAISSSGRSENILAAARAARKRDCRVVTLSGFDPANPLRGLGDLNFYVPAKSYGHVEIAHLAILHGILDSIVTVHGRVAGAGVAP